MSLVSNSGLLVRSGESAALVILNLVAKALLFGHSSEAFEDELVKNVVAKTDEIWREKGPVGKLHNFVHWIHKSDLSHISFELYKRNSPGGPMARNSQVFETANRGMWLPIT